MRKRSQMRIAWEVGLLVGCLLLFGCPKKPEVAQAPPSPPGPAAAVVQEQVQETVVQPVPAPAPPAAVQETVKEEVQVVQTITLQERLLRLRHGGHSGGPEGRPRRERERLEGEPHPEGPDRGPL